MKVMIFLDHQNFCQSLWRINQNRQERISGISDFVMNHLNRELNWEKYLPRLIRSYIYTGAYTDTTISKIKYDLEKAKAENSRYMRTIEDVMKKSQRRQNAQKKTFEQIKNNSSFLEIRTKPLQYSRGRIFQKGVDVQLAVDLVSHAYLNSYDVAVVCSGDVDLIESIKLVKNLGKKIIVISHPANTAEAIFDECDYYIDISKLSDEELNKISHLVEHKDEEGIFSKNLNGFPTPNLK